MSELADYKDQLKEKIDLLMEASPKDKVSMFTEFYANEHTLTLFPKMMQDRSKRTWLLFIVLQPIKLDELIGDIIVHRSTFPADNRASESEVMQCIEQLSKAKVIYTKFILDRLPRFRPTLEQFRPSNPPIGGIKPDRWARHCTYVQRNLLPLLNNEC
jgi:hypothetical protein